jgi:predicted DNA-binding protein
VSSLPSHLFQQLPTQTSTNIYEFILTNVLLSLAYEKTAEGRYDKKLNCDRFYSYRLVLLLLSNGQARFGRLSTFYLENICRHTKLEQVERVYLHELATEAIQAEQSDFLSKYAMSSAANYQVTFTNRKVVLTPKELKDYLDPIADLLCEEMDLYFQAYVTTTFMKQP